MDILPQFSLLIPLIVGLVEIVKMMGLGSRYLPLVSIVLGVILTFLLNDFNIIQGIIIGLTATGLYSGSKAVIGK